VHECAHALVAWWGGDDTARLQGRITLNPISHIDIFGTVLIPIIAALSSMPLIGWAKPVPVNLSRLKKPSWDVLVTLAGPGSNLLLALIATGIMRFALPYIPREEGSPLFMLGFYFIVTNVTLCIFNLLPIPPLDGSRVVFHYFINGRPQLYPLWEGLERFSIIFLYLIISLSVTRNLLQMATRGLLDPMFNFIGL
jgi:Zn-dependent protease